MVHSGILAVPAGAPSCDAHRALETIDVAVLVGQEAERQDPGAEIAVSLVEIPREGLRHRGAIAGPHAHHDREEHAVDISGVQKGSIRDRDARPGLRLIASADVRVGVARSHLAAASLTSGSSATEARIMSGGTLVRGRAGA